MAQSPFPPHSARRSAGRCSCSPHPGARLAAHSAGVLPNILSPPRGWAPTALGEHEQPFGHKKRAPGAPAVRQSGGSPVACVRGSPCSPSAVGAQPRRGDMTLGRTPAVCAAGRAPCDRVRAAAARAGAATGAVARGRRLRHGLPALAGYSATVCALLLPGAATPPLRSPPRGGVPSSAWQGGTRCLISYLCYSAANLSAGSHCAAACMHATATSLVTA